MVLAGLGLQYTAVELKTGVWTTRRTFKIEKPISGVTSQRAPCHFYLLIDHRDKQPCPVARTSHVSNQQTRAKNPQPSTTLSSERHRDRQQETKPSLCHAGRRGHLVVVVADTSRGTRGPDAQMYHMDVAICPCDGISMSLSGSGSVPVVVSLPVVVVPHFGSCGMARFDAM